MSMPCRTGSPAVNVPTTLPSAGQRQETSPAVATTPSDVGAGSAAVAFVAGAAGGTVGDEEVVEFGGGAAAAGAGALATGSNGPGFVAVGGLRGAAGDEVGAAA